MLLVDVCINLPVKHLNNTFTYSVPEQFSHIDVGWRIVVPFSNNKVEGFVIKKYRDFYEEKNLKAIEDVLDDSAWFDKNMFKIAKWISEYYLCTLAEAMRLFLPGKKSISVETYYSLSEEATKEIIKDDFVYKIIELLSNKELLNKNEIKKQIELFNEKTFKKLIDKKIIYSNKIINTNFKKSYYTNVKLVCDAENYLKENPKCPSARKKAIELLRNNPDGLSTSFLRKESISLDTIKRMEAKKIVVVEKIHQKRNSYENLHVKTKNILLNDEQKKAFKEIETSINSKKADKFLLYGITGSGKTEVYLDSSEKVYSNGQQVLVLVPEIGLTGQIIRRFKERFTEDVLVVHSKLSRNERMDVFEYIKTGAPCVLIGVRSAIFAPFSNLGLIIIDEEHEYSYKQEERPCYHARDVAEKMSDIYNIPLILGSATPSMESYYNSLNGKYKLLKLLERATSAILPEIFVVDMKKELQKGNRGVLSKKLLEELFEIENRKEQAIILLNRRGYSTFIICRDCGFVAKCDNCAVSLVYHKANELLRCHYCDYVEEIPDECPVCRSRRIRFFGTGTQKAEEQINENFPKARIIRMDQDTTRKKLSHDKILSDFRAGKYDILLGTQMVAKGHDIHNVTLVGVLSADSIMNLPDFRAGEKTFALLTQAAGRAGRGDKRGLVVLQVYEADNPIIEYVCNHDYESFANTTLKEREELFYPPYSDIIKIYIIDKNKENSMQKALDVKSTITSYLNDKKGLPNTDILGPFQGVVYKINNIYRSTIMIKTKDSFLVKECLRESGLIFQSDVIIDINPFNVF